MESPKSAACRRNYNSSGCGCALSRLFVSLAASANCVLGLFGALGHLQELQKVARVMQPICFSISLLVRLHSDSRIWKTIKMKPVEEMDRKRGGYFGRVLETGSKPACEFCSYSQESALAAAVFWFPDLVPRLRRKCENKWMRRCDPIPPKSGK